MTTAGRARHRIIERGSQAGITVSKTEPSAPIRCRAAKPNGFLGPEIRLNYGNMTAKSGHHGSAARQQIGAERFLF
jgi:hypothetical protein